MNKRNKISYIVLTVLCFIIGIGLAYLMAYALTTNYREREGGTPIAKKDTVFVKIVDSLLSRPFIQGIGTTAKIDTPTVVNRPVYNENDKDSQSVPRGYNVIQGGDSAAPLHLNPQNKLIAFNADSASNAWRLKLLGLARNDQNYNFEVLVVIIVIICLIAFLGFTYDRTLLQLFIKERLPSELLDLVKKQSNQEQIDNLETPRKRKRFANKLRFQYSFLKAKGLLGTEANLQYLMDLLIFLEDRPKLIELDRAPGDNTQQKLREVCKEIRKVKPDTNCSAMLLEEIVMLNIV